MENMDLRCLLSWDMGLGKTIATLGCLYRNPQALPAVIVCPSSVKYMWESEAARFGFRAAVAEGQTPPDYLSGRLCPHERMLIINYDILPYWVDALRLLGLRTIVLDECQMIGSVTAARTKAAAEVAAPLSHAIALSGTPLTNRPAELWPTLNIVRPDLFPSFWKFACDHCEPKMVRGQWQYRGARNLKQLNHKLEDVMIRRRKDEVLTDLPSKMRRVVPVELRNISEYMLAENDFMRWLKMTDPSKVQSAGRAEQMVRVGYLLRLAARLKMKSVVEWVNHFLESVDEKLVLFAVHTKAIDTLKRRCKAKSVVVDGSVTGRDRKAAVDQFRRDRKTRLFIGNIKAAGTGIDGLQTVCQTAAFAEMWWSPGTMIQAEDRIHRIGQEGSAQIVYFVARKTIEEKLCKTLQAKQAVIDETLDGTAVVDNLDVFSQFVYSVMMGA